MLCIALVYNGVVEFRYRHVTAVPCVTLALSTNTYYKCEKCYV